jgi:cobalt-zinc-cadmium efflux system membrane fusion protein
MQARFNLSLSVCLAALVSLAACSDKEPAAPATPVAAASQPLQPGQVRVEPGSLKFLQTQVAGAQGGSQTVWMPARVAFRTEQVSEVVSPVSGRVTQLQAQIGDMVKAGAPLATLSSPDASRIRADYSNAQVELKVAQAEAQRQHLMFDKGVGVEVDLQLAEAKLQEARHNADTAARASSFLGNGGSDSIVLRAPRAGVVIARTATLGSAVTSDTGSLFTVGDPTALWITADVFDTELNSVKEGDAVQVQLGSDASVPGKVLRVSAALDPQTRRAPVYITLDKPDPQMRAGMLARAGIETHAPQGLSVPVNAVLIKDGQHSIVFVQVSETVFQARPVDLGQPADGLIPVLKGINPGDKVVVKGALLLDGSAGQLL